MLSTITAGVICYGTLNQLGLVPRWWFSSASNLKILLLPLLSGLSYVLPVPSYCLVEIEFYCVASMKCAHLYQRAGAAFYNIWKYFDIVEILCGNNLHVVELSLIFIIISFWKTSKDMSFITLESINEISKGTEISEDIFVSQLASSICF